MDYESVSADAFGASLRGLGLNLLVPDITREISFLTATFNMTAHRVSIDFAIILSGPTVFQLHADQTYGDNPYLGLLPETPPRGAGAEMRLYDIDPDEAAGRAEAAGGHVLQSPTDKPHGLREAYILSPSGYCWVASRPL